MYSSTGAHSFSIWIHHLNHIKFDSKWNGTEDVAIVGSGQQWGNVYDAAARLGIVIRGADGSVGLGGHIQGGGYGPRSSVYGLAPDQDPAPSNTVAGTLFNQWWQECYW